MTSFVVKKIVQKQTVGEKLQAAREQLGLTLKQVANNLKIGTKYLQALENNAYNLIPGEVYAKSFLKSYINFLQLDLPTVLSQYQKERLVSKGSAYKESVGEVSDKHLRRWSKILRQVVVISLAVFCLVYLASKVQNILADPLLVINQPVDNLVTNQEKTEILGQTEVGATVTINGQAVLVDSQGNFFASLDLQKDVNNIKIVATKKSGKTAVGERRVIYNP